MLTIALTLGFFVARELHTLWLNVAWPQQSGILIVEFANQLRDAGQSIRSALVEASVTRFRPILMTSLATAIGAVPLMLWQGAGTQSRFAIGIVVFAGVIFSTALTLFVVPAFYNLLARFTRAPGAIAAEIAILERLNSEPATGAH